MTSWSSLPQLQYSHSELEAHSKEWAFVVLRFYPPEPSDNILDFILRRSQIISGLVTKIEERFEPISMQQDGQFFTLLFESPRDALICSLLLLQEHNPLFCLAIGHDQGYMFDYFQSTELLLVKLALSYGDHHEIQMSPSLKQLVEIPQGVGAFQCSPALAKASGMNYWVLKDYR